ncbi:Mtc4p ASCRUDRAFT_115190 [Ascoidea rubescens DSM 1968]|uniref:Uncharacterized protein n=1 Tax=Ascoidea rubescens DSM 1968 TaxID=1344418 RepID=A0A1D2VBQ1_9ASCO|nr:hypothetical protein ASCRUDRAFT_115190 [Ascoidea rubescens DSM 1968]ODV58982.1 hypothetical protein ASCRUDRAFT_115190 [Ascoidea rubescens DSM 1968]
MTSNNFSVSSDFSFSNNPFSKYLNQSTDESFSLYPSRYDNQNVNTDVTKNTTANNTQNNDNEYYSKENISQFNKISSSFVDTRANLLTNRFSNHDLYLDIADSDGDIDTEDLNYGVTGSLYGSINNTNDKSSYDTDTNLLRFNPVGFTQTINTIIHNITSSNNSNDSKYDSKYKSKKSNNKSCKNSNNKSLTISKNTFKRARLVKNYLSLYYTYIENYQCFPVENLINDYNCNLDLIKVYNPLQIIRNRLVRHSLIEYQTNQFNQSTEINQLKQLGQYIKLSFKIKKIPLPSTFLSKRYSNQTKNAQTNQSNIEYSDNSVNNQAKKKLSKSIKIYQSNQFLWEIQLFEIILDFMWRNSHLNLLKNSTGNLLFPSIDIHYKEVQLEYHPFGFSNLNLPIIKNSKSNKSYNSNNSISSLSNSNSSSQFNSIIRFNKSNSPNSTLKSKFDNLPSIKSHKKRIESENFFNSNPLIKCKPVNNFPSESDFSDSHLENKNDIFKHLYKENNDKDITIECSHSSLPIQSNDNISQQKKSSGTNLIDNKETNIVSLNINLNSMPLHYHNYEHERENQPSFLKTTIMNNNTKINFNDSNANLIVTEIDAAGVDFKDRNQSHYSNEGESAAHKSHLLNIVERPMSLKNSKSLLFNHNFEVLAKKHNNYNKSTKLNNEKPYIGPSINFQLNEFVKDFKCINGNFKVCFNHADVEEKLLKRLLKKNLINDKFNLINNDSQKIKKTIIPNNDLNLSYKIAKLDLIKTKFLNKLNPLLDVILSNSDRMIVEINTSLSKRVKEINEIIENNILSTTNFGFYPGYNSEEFKGEIKVAKKAKKTNSNKNDLMNESDYINEIMMCIGYKLLEILIVVVLWVIWGTVSGLRVIRNCLVMLSKFLKIIIWKFW